MVYCIISYTRTNSYTVIYNIFLPADEIVEILARLKPEKYSKEFFKNYINLVLSVFYVATKDLPELKHQVCIFFYSVYVYCSYMDVHLVENKIIWILFFYSVNRISNFLNHVNVS